MKKLSILAACAAASLFLAGCASTPTDASNAQAAISTACPIVQIAVADMQALGTGLGGQTQIDLASATPVINTVCAANGQVDTASLASLVQTVLPALIADVNATALPAETKAKVGTALAVAQIALTAVLKLAPTTSAPPPVNPAAAT